MVDNTARIGGSFGSDPTTTVTNIVNQLQQAGVTNLNTTQIIQAWSNFAHLLGPSAPLFMAYLADALKYQVISGSFATAA